MASQSQSFIKLMHKDPATLVDKATESFSADFATFAKSNNRGDLDIGTSELKNTRHDLAFAAAAAAAWKAADLATGRIGSGKCKWHLMPEADQKPYLDAIARYETAFKQSLIDSGLFVAPTPKTDVEKAKAKAEKAEKAEKAKADIITAMVQAGELVRSADHTATVEALLAERDALREERDALKAELAKWTQYKQSYDDAIKAVTA